MKTTIEQKERKEEQLPASGVPRLRTGGWGVGMEQTKTNYPVKMSQDKNEGNETKCHPVISGWREKMYQFSRKVSQETS